MRIIICCPAEFSCAKLTETERERVRGREREMEKESTEENGVLVWLSKIGKRRGHL